MNILREFRHPHIVRYYDRIIDKSRTKIFIVMEYCAGGDLAAYIKKCRREKKRIDEEVMELVGKREMSSVQVLEKVLKKPLPRIQADLLAYLEEVGGHDY